MIVFIIAMRIIALVLNAQAKKAALQNRSKKDMQKDDPLASSVSGDDNSHFNNQYFDQH
ncbi:MAG: hypothetical protein V1661_00850 [bacterium]